MTFSFLASLCYNSSRMNSKGATDKKISLTKYQIYLGIKLQQRLAGYFNDQYTKGDKVYSATFRKAIEEFLEKRGY